MDYKVFIMRYTSMAVFFILLFLSGCNSGDDQVVNNNETIQPIQRDLDQIKEDGVLKALVVYSSTSYFLYRGEPKGFEYELLQRLAEHLDLELEIVVANNIDYQFDRLNMGDVDLVAHGITITTDRKEDVKFTDYLYLVKQVLVQKKPDNWRQLSWSSLQKHLIRDPIELIGDTISVRQNTSYFERLVNLSTEIGGNIIIDTLPGDLSTDEIISMVVDGEIKYTVADDNLAMINASYYPILNIEVPLSFSQRIAWAVRKNSPQLLEAINEWIKQERKETDYYVIFNKYFKNERTFRRRIESDYYSLNNNQISQWDEVIKEKAEQLGWDWRLVASLIYQESRFDPVAQSWAGARGLMQVMPATARELGIENVNDPIQSIEGGTRYLDQLYRRFEEIEDSVQRIKFTMASYNCGYMHVRDAQRLAEEEGLETDIWDENVEKSLLALSYPRNYNKPFIEYGYVRGIEPVTYVRQIFERYQHYQNFIDEQKSD